MRSRPQGPFPQRPFGLSLSKPSLSEVEEPFDRLRASGVVKLKASGVEEIEAIGAGGLDHAGIAALIPHTGRMCLLDSLQSWSATQVFCTALSHHDLDNPLRSARGLLVPSAIEYAAQAMALHGALLAPPAAGAPRGGYLASVRSVRFARLRLDDLPGALQVQAERLAGDERGASYHFSVGDMAGAVWVEGRAIVALTPSLPTV